MKVSASDTWSSPMVFLLASVGAAVGLGNIWKFPYTVGVSGGGAFVLIYLLAAFAFALPILIAELIIGRRGQHNAIDSVVKVAEDAKVSKNWRSIGWFGMSAAFLTLSFYSVVAGWSLALLARFASGSFIGVTPDVAATRFQTFLQGPNEMIGWHIVFMTLTVLVILPGLHKGLERAVGLLMPALFVILIMLLGYSAVEGDMGQAITFLFQPDFSQVTPSTMLVAIGQAFFSVTVATAIMITYGSYLPANVNIPRSAVIIVTMDTMVALIAGIAIFPIVFQIGLDPAEGPGLVFVTLPAAFASMPGGTIFGTAFFILIAFAALTSSISIIETVTLWLREKSGLPRAICAILIGLAAGALGLLTVFSNNIWSELYPLSFLPGFETRTWFDSIDATVTTLLMPLGGILISLFVGWRLPHKLAKEDFGGAGVFYFLWRWLLRVPVPIGLTIMLITGLI